MAALKKIGGSSGKANGTKVIRSVVNKLISTEFMAQTSWTGKSSGGKQAKIKFQAYTQIIQLISDVCIIADRTLDEQMVLNDLKYKIIKYAYTNSQMASSSSSLSRSSASSPSIEILTEVSSLDDAQHNQLPTNPSQSHSKQQSNVQTQPVPQHPLPQQLVPQHPLPQQPVPQHPSQHPYQSQQHSNGLPMYPSNYYYDQSYYNQYTYTTL